MPISTERCFGGILMIHESATPIQRVIAARAYRSHRACVSLSTAIVCAISALSIGGAPGCDLGYVDIAPKMSVSVRVRNTAADTVVVTLASSATAMDENTDGSIATVEVRVPAGEETDGSVECGEFLSIRALMGENSAEAIQLSGAGTGTPGFDSGTVGGDGERFFERDVHFTCDDTLYVEVTSASSGSIQVEPNGFSAAPDDGNTSGEDESGNNTAGQNVSVRLENATATDADLVVERWVVSETGAASEPATPVRVPPGEYSTGTVACGDTLRISATIVDASASVVQLSGDGTGTVGFDSSSVGILGERWLVFGDDFSCADSIVIRIDDDGSGIGSSESNTPLGSVRVFTGSETVPEPELPELVPDEATPSQDQVTLVIDNRTESTVQVNFAAGNGSLGMLDGNGVVAETDIRVPPGLVSQGRTACPREFVIAAAHLESIATTVEDSPEGDFFAGGGSVNFHGIVLTGDGTGTDGFDENSIAVVRGRLLQNGIHFDCGNVLTVVVTATNNQIQLDDEGLPVLDEFGNVTIKYNVGSGHVTVTAVK